MKEREDNVKKIEWSINVPIFKTSLILKQLGIAIGIPFGLIIIFLLTISDDNTYTFYAFSLITALFVLTYIFIRIIYGGKYHVGFTIDNKGIRYYTQKNHLRKNNIINTLTIILGLISGKPSITGAGILAQSRQAIFIKWGGIRRVKYCPKQYTIMIKGGTSENIGVFCTKENYLEVEELIKSRVQL
ncbi:hypothetical protein SAMN05660462_02992 [Proteiniborus ethanoligenes]|uniref:Uncharacterized protein n=1 Tax=Proteiniborus ethanoligenes TaxID=415015 RepID=A0A1H3SM72_9FIRM|nr:hypothetical protein [Proteiniborus ethanoligenes]SDZ39086.1 hypothetical protein SAMN05660462_02992 [Proteiniborus ethanoligenes]